MKYNILDFYIWHPEKLESSWKYYSSAYPLIWHQKEGSSDTFLYRDNKYKLWKEEYSICENRVLERLFPLRDVYWEHNHRIKFRVTEIFNSSEIATWCYTGDKRKSMCCPHLRYLVENTNFIWVNGKRYGFHKTR